MMKSLLFVALVMIQAPLHAATWTVDNNPARPANFQNLQDAVAAAADGDTLLIAGSNTSYGIVTLDKRLILKGPGYFPENNVSGAAAGVAKVGAPVMTASAASGSRFEGLEITGSTTVAAGVSQIVFRRVRFTANLTIQGSACMVVQTYFDGVWFTVSGDNAVIANSRISGVELTGNGITVDQCVILTGGGQMTASNLPVIRNSIIVSNLGAAGAHTAAVAFENCLGVGRLSLPVGNGNTSGLTAEQVFASGPDTDARYRLAEASPAMGAGPGGTDLGMFGGSNPYVLSGIPALPRVTALRADAVVPDSTGLKFEVEVEARD
ncbi:MAG: hypothetical protein KDN22_24590 [Verrucomicrobiae bacterium]|nr:hypothetical protein [Verrucomicrobiae bacterium]